MKKIFILITVMSFVLTWSGKVLSSEIGYGEIENDIYINRYFNMSLAVPNGWAVQSKAAIKDITDRGGNLIAGDDQNLKAVLKEAEKQTVNLFAFFKYEQGSPVDFNPSIMSVAERVSNQPGIKRGADYLFHAKKILQTGQVKYTFPNEVYTKQISGTSFDVMPAEINIGSSSIYQRFYATRIKDYVLTIILTHSSEPESNELLQVINKLKL